MITSLTEARGAIAEYDSIKKVRDALASFTAATLTELNLVYRDASSSSVSVPVTEDYREAVQTLIQDKVDALTAEMATIESSFT